MKIETRTLGELKPAPYNPRVDLKPGDPTYEKLKRSIKEFGLVEPIILNKTTGLVVGGHQRLKILKELGAESDETDVVVVELSAWEERALNIALNKIGGEWNIPLLKEILIDLDDGGLDPTITGFDLEELKKLIEYEKGVLGGPDDEAPQPKLDEKNPVKCPKCGNEFTPKT